MIKKEVYRGKGRKKKNWKRTENREKLLKKEKTLKRNTRKLEYSSSESCKKKAKFKKNSACNKLETTIFYVFNLYITIF